MELTSGTPGTPRTAGTTGTAGRRAGARDVLRSALRTTVRLRSARVAALTCAALAGGLLPGTAIVASAAPPAPAVSTDGTLFHAADQALGHGWRSSADRAVTGTGDTAGFHLLVADEASSFTYHEVADLTEEGLDGIGPWTGYVCTTGSGRYAAAVYAPSTATNTPALMQHGAFSAVVNLATGKVVKTVQGVQLAYFSPACGSGDTVAFTRSSVGDDAAKGTTEVFDVDAATGRTLHTTTVHGQFTNPLPTAGGDVGVVRGRLVRAARDGSLSTLATLPGPAFALAPSGDAVDIATVEHGKDVLHRWTGSALTSLGTAPKGAIGLFAQADGDLVAGDVTGIDSSKAKGLHKIASKQRPVAASRQGHLLVTAVASEELKSTVSKVGASDGQGAGTIRVTGEATATATPATTYLATPEAAAAAAAGDADDTERLIGDGTSEMDSMAVGGAQAADPSPESHYSSCLVKRDSIDAQALQPSPNMVEWAVDQAVHGDLTVSRPADFLGTGMPAYSPQGLFPKPALSGGGTVPAQVLLGLLAQESNFKQATWHAVPGDGGNPLLGDYYGNADSIHYYPNYGGSDCGYGVSQVTSGMSEIKGTPFTPNKAWALATDYAANIAAGLDILGQTWNQLKQLGMNDNSGSPQYIENWFMALWGYNSGVYTDGSANNGHTGLGWFNNPANPNYPADRSAYLRSSYGDASHPADWPYEEKVMGWAETPQLDAHGNPSYSKPNLAELGLYLNLNGDYSAYCSGANNCTPHQTPDPCPSEDETCWFRGSVSWMSDSDGTASTEHLAYALGSGEPALQRQYAAPPCANAPGTLSAIVIDDIPDSDANVFGCKENPDYYRHGTFKLRLGDSITMNRDDGSWRATEDIAPIDLHQLSAGYDGHMWFTHDYAAPLHPEASTSNFLWHQVTATWAPDPEELPASGQPGEDMDIYVHLPSHGAQAKVLYTVTPGRNTAGAVVHQCPLTQSKYTNGNDVWLELGSVTLWQGAHVTANNTLAGGTGDGSLDVAFDAVAFVPVGGHVSGTCGFNS